MFRTGDPPGILNTAPRRCFCCWGMANDYISGASESAERTWLIYYCEVIIVAHDLRIVDRLSPNSASGGYDENPEP